MKIKIKSILIASAILMFFIAGCNGSVASEATAVISGATTSTSLPLSTPKALDTQVLLDQAVDHFLTATSLQMKIHDITSYNAITADSTVRSIYGEFDTVYDIQRLPEMKIRVQSDFRFSPESDFYSEEYYLFEQDNVAYMLTFDKNGEPLFEETSGQSIDMLIGDAYQAVMQYGKEAQFDRQEDDGIFYVLDIYDWYTLSGAVSFADLGLLYAQPNGEDLVKEYAQRMYPNVQPIQLILQISLADRAITAIEVNNQAFVESFWEAYDQVLVDQGVDPKQLTHYEIQPEHGGECFVGEYDQVQDFDIPD